MPRRLGQKTPIRRKQQLLRKNERLANPELSNDAKPFFNCQFSAFTDHVARCITDDGMITDCRDGLVLFEVQPQAVKYLRTGGHGSVED